MKMNATLSAQLAAPDVAQFRMVNTVSKLHALILSVRDFSFKRREKSINQPIVRQCFWSACFWYMQIKANETYATIVLLCFGETRMSST